MPRTSAADLLGSSLAIVRTTRLAEQLAPSKDPVLILGEPGTGKTTLARFIHARSKRSGSFFSFSVASSTDELALSALFGHSRGAYTGADRERPGLIESARDGTLLLDELGLASERVQAALLSLFDPEALRRIGEDRPRIATTRFLFATNTELRSAVEQGKFRRDLLDRIGYLVVRMPPLRERRLDIPLLFDAFLTEAQAEPGAELPPTSVDPAVYDFLVGFHWPGNVRQLQNVARAAALLAEPGVPLGIRHFPPEFLVELNLSANGKTPDLIDLAEAALDRAAGNESEAARALHLARSTFRRLVERGRRRREPSGGQT